MIETVIAPVVGAGLVIATVLMAMYRRPRPARVR